MSRTTLGVAVLCMAALAYDFMLGVIRRKDRAFPSTDPTESTWWFGYLRDITNLGAVGCFWLGFWLIGFPGHLALLGGLTFGLLAYGLDYLLARRIGVARPEWVLGILVVLLTIPVFVLRDEAAVALQRLVDLLFSGSTARREGG